LSLAEEIAHETNYRLVQSVAEALDGDPVYAIWVVSPGRFTDRDLVSYGVRVRHRRSAISLGFITGGTLEKAREFWNRSGQASAQRVAVINGRFPSARILKGRILRFCEDGKKSEPLNLTSMRTVLQRSDYVSFTGHGTPTSLKLDANTAMRPEGVPLLPPLVLTTASCNTFRFWDRNSILLAFIDNGVAAYAGFSYSPNAGYLLGALDGLAFRYTWPEFPVGHAVQVLNEGCRQGFAYFPYYHLAGDPRIALAKEPPYQLVEDRRTPMGRTLVFSNAPAGVLPVRVPGGAGYRFVSIPGVTAASDCDWFYNSRLQMTDIAGDKYILFEHGGGDFTVELYPRPPATWVFDRWLDALDFTLIYNMQNGGDIIQIIAGALALVWISFLLRNRREAHYWPLSLLTGLSFAVLHGAYVWLRMDHVTINSRPVAFSWIALPGTFLLATGGTLLYLNARRWLGRAIGAILPPLIPLLTSALIPALLFFQGLKMRRLIGAPIWNYQLAWVNLLALIVLIPICVVWFEAIRRLQLGRDAVVDFPGET